MNDLSKQKCVPCEGGVSPMEKEDIEKNISLISSEWQVAGLEKIFRKFIFKDFKEAISFVNKVGDIAETENHHPDIELGWGYVVVNLSTHAIKGISINDFILASKIDEL